MWAAVLCTPCPEGVSIKKDLKGRIDTTRECRFTSDHGAGGTGSNPRLSSVPLPYSTALVPAQATTHDVTAQMAPGQPHTASHACETDSKRGLRAPTAHTTHGQ